MDFRKVKCHFCFAFLRFTENLPLVCIFQVGGREVRGGCRYKQPPCMFYKLLTMEVLFHRMH